MQNEEAYYHFGCKHARNYSLRMDRSTKTHTADVGPVSNNLQQKVGFIFRKPMDGRPVRRKRREIHIANLSEDIQSHRLQRLRYKGLVNLTTLVILTVLLNVSSIVNGPGKYKEFTRKCTINSFAGGTHSLQHNDQL